MISSRAFHKLMIGFYMLIFFGYLFGPLVIMVITAFNNSEYPQIYPFNGFTLRWFDRLFADRDIMLGLKNAVIIGVLVVCVSVPVGLAGAILMTQVYDRARSFYYLVVVSPVLTPGVIIGISTVIFWRDMTNLTGARFMFDGFVMTVLGQSCFISAYCMLIFLSRLQRFDKSQEEAALDLGASYTQVFFHILLPFLRPAILSAAVLALLSSFENYNTTTFTILSDKTFTTVLAGRVRQGTTPTISAVAVIIIGVTLAGAIIYELLKRYEDRQTAMRLRRAALEERAALTASPAAA
jgi:spermidine/putrescine transport system permease protein